MCKGDIAAQPRPSCIDITSAAEWLLGGWYGCGDVEENPGWPIDFHKFVKQCATTLCSPQNPSDLTRDWLDHLSRTSTSPNRWAPIFPDPASQWTKMSQYNAAYEVYARCAPQLMTIGDPFCEFENSEIEYRHRQIAVLKAAQQIPVWDSSFKCCQESHQMTHGKEHLTNWFIKHNYHVFGGRRWKRCWVSSRRKEGTCGVCKRLSNSSIPCSTKLVRENKASHEKKKRFTKCSIFVFDPWLCCA